MLTRNDPTLYENIEDEHGVEHENQARPDFLKYRAQEIEFDDDDETMDNDSAPKSDLESDQETN